MVEAEIRKIIKSVLDSALEIDIVIEAIQKSHQLENLHEIEWGCDSLDVVHLHRGLSWETFLGHLPVVVLVKSTMDSLHETSWLLDVKVENPHLFELHDLISGLIFTIMRVSWLSVNEPFLLNTLVSGSLLLFWVTVVSEDGYAHESSDGNWFNELHFL